MNTFPMLLKREYWEHRGGFLWAPFIAGGVFLAFLIMALAVAQSGVGRANIQLGALRLNELTQRLDDAQRAMLGAGIDATMLMVAGQIGFVVAIVVFFYCLGALYDDRRDRSVLFWKSLPISDRDTVLSKVVSAVAVAPAIGIVAGIATGLGMLLIIGIYLAFHGINVFGLILSAAHPLQVAAILVGVLPVYIVWALPTVGWLLLCSAWARSKPFLWALALPVGAGILVSWFDLMRSWSLPDSWFWTHVVGRALLSVVPGSWMSVDEFQRFDRINDPTELLNAMSLSEHYAVLAQPATWIGAAIGMAMIVLAIRLRRWRDEG